MQPKDIFISTLFDHEQKDQSAKAELFVLKGRKKQVVGHAHIESTASQAPVVRVSLLLEPQEQFKTGSKTELVLSLSTPAHDKSTAEHIKWAASRLYSGVPKSPSAHLSEQAAAEMGVDKAREGVVDRVLFNKEKSMIELKILCSGGYLVTEKADGKTLSESHFTQAVDADSAVEEIKFDLLAQGQSEFKEVERPSGKVASARLEGGASGPGL